MKTVLFTRQAESTTAVYAWELELFLSVCHVRMFHSGLLKPASKSIAKHRNRSLSDNKWLYLDWKISVYFTAHMPLLSLPPSPGPRVAHTDADVHATRHTRESEGELRRWYFKLNRFYTPPYGPHPKSKVAILLGGWVVFNAVPPITVRQWCTMNIPMLDRISTTTRGGRTGRCE